VVTPTLSPANVPLTTPTTASPVNVILVIASVGIAFLVMVRKRR
jgi:hypothetical protein